MESSIPSEIGKFLEDYSQSYLEENIKSILQVGWEKKNLHNALGNFKMSENPLVDDISLILYRYSRWT